jgi:hypothetical protein
MTQIIGIVILSLVFLGLFIMTSRAMGFLMALGVWLAAIVLTAVIVLGLFLAVGGVS